MADAKPMITIEHVGKWFDDFHVLKDVNLTVREGHDIAHAVKDALLASTAHGISDVSVHVEPMK